MVSILETMPMWHETYFKSFFYIFRAAKGAGFVFFVDTFCKYKPILTIFYDFAVAFSNEGTRREQTSANEVDAEQQHLDSVYFAANLNQKWSIIGIWISGLILSAGSLRKCRLMDNLLFILSSVSVISSSSVTSGQWLYEKCW